MDKSCLRKAFILWVLFLIIKGTALLNVLCFNNTVSDKSYNSKKMLFAITPVGGLLKKESVSLGIVFFAIDILTAALIFIILRYDVGKVRKYLLVIAVLLSLIYIVYLVVVPLYLALYFIMYSPVFYYLPGVLPGIALIFLAKSYKKPDF